MHRLCTSVFLERERWYSQILLVLAKTRGLVGEGYPSALCLAVGLAACGPSRSQIDGQG